MSRLPYLLLVGIAALSIACSATKDSRLDDDPNSTSTSGQGGGIGFDGGPADGGGLEGGDPKTCEEALQAKTYIGCDFYPTVTPNAVWSVFDFAVVVANTGENTVDATVTRGNTQIATAQIAPNSLATMYLPWVKELKGPDADGQGSTVALSGSVKAIGGAYHLTTTFPVTVYQFSALEYAPQGGPPNKNWAVCPAFLIECFSYSNDASLLLPSTAMTSNYRIFNAPASSIPQFAQFFAITGVHDGTSVNVGLSASGSIVAGGGVQATPAGGSTKVDLNRGDVMMLLAATGSDLSGSLVSANNPIQIISGMPCTNVPEGASACDHVEETVFPAETLGQHYIVNRPTGPNGDVPGHVVRMYGNFDGTTLEYLGGAPPNAPTSLHAGQVVDLGVVTVDFEVQADKAFAVMSLEMGGSVVDPNGMIGLQKGDPAQSLPTAVEQYRDKYVFLAPTDYDVNYVDIVMPVNATVTLDGIIIAAQAMPVGTSGYGVTRVQLGPGQGGAHVLDASAPVGIQVTGYGAYTSYYYPGGLNLKVISPPPIN